MKLPIKKKYFDKIKAGDKFLEYRDAHITFICEETGETLRKEVIKCSVINSKFLQKIYRDVIKSEFVIEFKLK